MTVPILELKYFKELVQTRTGLTFDNSRQEMLRRQIAEVVGQGRYRSPVELYVALQQDEELFLEFVNHLTINETYFFREPQYLELLSGWLVPELLTGKRPGERLRIISAGCSTGEEPYSIAIALLERYGSEAGRLFSLVGFDLNSTALARAEAGVYGNLSFRGGDQALRDRYFLAAPFGLSELRPEVRDLVRFTRHNLLSPECPALLRPADIIFYRNVSIYFDPPTQRKILTSLAATMPVGGYLVFAAAETFSHQDIGVLSLVERQGLFYFQKVAEPAPLTAGSAPAAPAPGGRRPPARLPAAPKKPPPGRPTGGAPVAAAPPEARAELAPEALFREAVACLRKKEHQRAARLADRLQAWAEYRARADLLRGCILLHGDQARAAGEHFSRAAQADGLLLEAHLLLGLAAKMIGEEARAIRCFHKALYVQDSCWMAHYYLAELHLAGGNSRKALGYYGTLLKILASDTAEPAGLTFFPISFRRQDLIHLCRRKIAAISGNDHGL